MKANAIKGAELEGATYQPLFPYFADRAEEGTENPAFRVLNGDFVEEGEGTGIVHMAPAFGEDDQAACAAAGIELVCPVDEKGRYTDEIFDIVGAGDEGLEASKSDATKILTSNPYPLSLKGLNVVAETEAQCEAEPYTPEQLAKYGLANLRIIQWLKLQGRLIRSDDYAHNYPHCWRTDTPLIYRALSSWYVKVTAFRDRMVELNQGINWIPAHVKDGAMAHMLGTAPDWSISRNRFWGTPIPIWRSDNPDNDELYVFGSVAELNAFFDADVKDLHRPFIDDLTKPDPHNPEFTISRVEEVFDCWFESGSMPSRKCIIRLKIKNGLMSISPPILSPNISRKHVAGSTRSSRFQQRCLIKSPLKIASVMV